MFAVVGSVSVTVGAYCVAFGYFGNEGGVWYAVQFVRNCKVFCSWVSVVPFNNDDCFSVDNHLAVGAVAAVYFQLVRKFFLRCEAGAFAGFGFVTVCMSAGW